MAVVGIEGVAWFLMAEGSMFLMIRKDKQCKTGFRAAVEVCFTNSEIELLEGVKKYVSGQGIVSWLAEGHSNKGVTKPYYRLETEGMSNCHRLINILMPHLLGRKKEQAVLLTKWLKKYSRLGGGHHNIEGERARILESVDYRDRIRALGNRKGRINYPKQFFEELWA